MCSEQTRLSRFVIKGHQGSEQCVYTVETVQDSVCLAVYVTMCNECAHGLNYHTDCSL